MKFLERKIKFSRKKPTKSAEKRLVLFGFICSLFSHSSILLLQTELLGQNLYDYIDPDDHVELTKNLNADSFCSSSRSDNDDSNSCEEIATILSDGNTQEQRRTFNVRISHRAASRREHTQYECFHVSGILRLAEACKNNDTGRSRRGLTLRLFHTR